MSKAPSDLPRWRSPSGDLVELQRTQLLPADLEATAPVPQPPKWRPGLIPGEFSAHSEGRAFDRRTVMSAPVEADDGVYSIGGREVRGRPRTLPVEYIADRAWRPEELAAMEAEAVSMLQAHAFPTHLTWPEPGAWAWSQDGRLWWAETPTQGSLVNDAGVAAEISPGMSGALRGGLGLGMSAVPNVPPDPRSLSLWPRWSAFAWAVEVHDAARWRREIIAGLEQLTAAAAEVAIDLERHVRCSDAPDRWSRLLEVLRGEADALWRAGFALGAHVAQDRARRLAGPVVSAKLDLEDRQREAANTTNARQSRQRGPIKDAAEAETIDTVKELIEQNISRSPKTNRTWGPANLADLVLDGWEAKSGPKPTPGQLEGWICSWLQRADFPQPPKPSPGAAPRRRGVREGPNR